jgi:hypothetical protein
MSIQILMPALSPTMEEGKLAKWHVKEGDEVRSGDVLAEIETDKATMEFEAVDEGRIGKILVTEGTEGVKVSPSQNCCRTANPCRNNPRSPNRRRKPAKQLQSQFRQHGRPIPSPKQNSPRNLRPPINRTK